MKKVQTLLFIFLNFLVFQATAQNAILGSGFTNGWGGSCGASTDYEYFSSHASVSFGREEMATGTGNQYFRLGVDWSGTIGQHTIMPGSDTEVFSGVEYNLDAGCTTSGAMFTNVSSTSDIYYFKTFDAGTAPSFKMIFFKIQGAVRSVSSVTQHPTTVPEAQPVVVTATLDAAFATGQAVYLRYSNNMDISFSTVVKMTGGGTSYTATIPGYNEGDDVYYYVFTSGDLASISPANADFYTINLNNNGGSNYNYTVQAPLPISLVEFSAKTVDKVNKLSWQTATEINNSHFDVQRSSDARTWVNIGRVEGYGRSIQRQYYVFEDTKPLSGENYYRLIQVDYDGSFSHSPLLVLDNKVVRIDLFPNPVSDYFEVKFDVVNDRQQYVISLINTQGQVVRKMTAESTAVRIEMNGLAGGLYVVNIQDANGNIIYTKSLNKL